MKPFHAGLLMIAAALAGGLVVKMTQGPAPGAAVQAPVAKAPAVLRTPEPELVSKVDKPSPVAQTKPPAPVPAPTPTKTHAQIARSNPILPTTPPYQPSAKVVPPAAPQEQV